MFSLFPISPDFFAEAFRVEAKRPCHKMADMTFYVGFHAKCVSGGFYARCDRAVHRRHIPFNRRGAHRSLSTRGEPLEHAYRHALGAALSRDHGIGGWAGGAVCRATEASA